MTDQNSKTKPQKKPKTKILKWALLFLVALIILVVFLVPAFVSSSKGQKIILAKINDSIDGRTNFSSFSMGWLKGIRIAGISFNDNAGRTSVQVEQISTKPHYGSILTGTLSFGETIIDKPRVKINLKALPETEARQADVGKESRQVVLPVRKIDMVVNDGSLEVTGRQGETVELSKINSRLNLRPPGRQTDFDMDLAVIDEGKESKLRADGRLTPGKRTGWTLEGTSGDLTVEVNDLDLESLGPVFTLAGVEVQAKGTVSADLKSEIKDGRFENLNGTVKGRDLDVTASQLKGDSFKSSTLDVAIKLARKGQMINIDNLEVRADWLKAQASGDVPTTFESLAEFITADSKQNLKGSFECDIARLASQMPMTLGLKEGTKITSGVLSGQIEKVAQAGQRRIVGRASLTGLQGMVGARKVALSEPVVFEADITSDKDHIKYDKLEVSAPFAKVNCTGNSESLKYNANVNLAKLQSELGQFVDIGQYRMAGELLSEGTISGSQELISTSGSSVIKNLHLSSKDGLSAIEPKADLTFAFDVDRKSNVVNVDSVRANASFGQVGSQNAVLPLNEKAAKPMNLPIAAKVDLAKLQPFLVMFGASRLKDMQLAGIAESAISVRCEKDVYKVTTDSTKIKNFKLISEQKSFEQQDVSFLCDAKVNAAEKTFAVNCQLSSPEINIKLNLGQTTKNNKAKLEGQADLDYNWSAVSSIVSPFLPGGLSLKGQQKDKISFVSEYPAGQSQQLLANLNTEGKLGFEQAEYMGLNFGPTKVDIKVANGMLTIPPFSTTVNNGKLNFAGNVNFREKPMVLRIPKPMQIMDKVNINEDVSRNLLVYLNPIFKDQANITGVANFQCDTLNIPLGVDTANLLEIIGTVGIEKMRLQTIGLAGEILSRAPTKPYVDSTLLPTKFVMRKGRLSYDDMQLNVDEYPVNFKGAIGPNRKLDMAIISPYVLTSDFKIETVKIDDKTTAKRISLPLGGTIDNPELEWSRLLETIFNQHGEEILRRGLEELFK